MRNLSETLKELRLNAGLTQKELSTKLGLGQSTIVGYERAISEPTIHNLTLYAKFFGVTVDELLGVSEERAARVAAPTGDSVAADKAQNAQERELLKLFRELSPYLQDLMLQTVRNWAGKAGKPGAVNVQKKA